MKSNDQEHSPHKAVRVSSKEGKKSHKQCLLGLQTCFRPTPCVRLLSLFQENLVWYNPITVPQLNSECVEQTLNFFCLIGHTCHMCKFQGQGSNPSLQQLQCQILNQLHHKGTPVPCGFDYCSFVVSSEVCTCYASCLIFVPVIALAILGQYKFLDCLFQFGENRHG